jgi:hypothetical protein
MAAMSQYVKYPRTPHLPWSQGRSKDDIVLTGISHLEKLPDIIVTEKLDGECTTFYHDYLHARSIDSKAHESRSWVKQLHSRIKHRIPDDLRICGENLYARHTVFYDSLSTYFYVFAMFRNDACLSWDETAGWCKDFSLETVPVLYRGAWNEKAVQACWKGVSAFGKEQEGFVVRNAGSFSFEKFRENTAKFVRKGHVADNDVHWMKKKVVPNKLLTLAVVLILSILAPSFVHYIKDDTVFLSLPGKKEGQKHEKEKTNCQTVSSGDYVIVTVVDHSSGAPTGKNALQKAILALGEL